MKRLISLVLAFVLAAVYCACAFAQDDGYIDHYTMGNFSKRHDVYSGPGEQYYRANEGKAMYGSGAVRYYGAAEDGWILIGYSLKGQGYRLGYIKAAFADMNTKGEDRTLTLAPASGLTSVPLDFYDDPDISEHKRPAICQIPESTMITCLGQFNADWTYVEIDKSILGSPARGFVRSGSIIPAVKGPGSKDAGASAGLSADGETQLTWETTSLAWSRTVPIASPGEWVACPEVTWISLSVEGNQLRIQLAENTDAAQRQGSILITCGENTAKVTVIQSGF